MLSRVAALAVASVVWATSDTSISVIQAPEVVSAQWWRLVRVVEREPAGFRPLGTGFILVRGRVAFVVTNEHVVRKAKGSPWVSIGKQAHQAESHVTDEAHDLAVLKLGADVDISGETSERTSSAAKGQDVYAFGFPDDLGTAVDPLISQGQVLWVGRYEPTQRMVITSGTYPGRTVSAFIVAGITCRQGASGGPVFDKSGAIVGYVKGMLDTGECLCLSIERALELL